MKKFVIITLSVMAFAIDGIAQDFSQYVGGKGKMYVSPTFGNELYVANISYSAETVFRNDMMASSLAIYDGNQFVSYPSSFGGFVEFDYCFKVTGGYITSPQFLFWVIDIGLCAFVMNENKLHIVNVLEDRILCTLYDLIFKEDDFRIMVKEDSNMYGDKFQPSIMVINQGNVNIFRTIFSTIPSAVRSAAADESVSDHTYSLDGRQVNSPHNGLFVKDGKKVVIK